MAYNNFKGLKIMTTKVNGFLKQGKWFEKDTCIMHVIAGSGTPFSMPTGVRQGDLSGGGTAEAIFHILGTRGTIIGYNVVSDTVAAFMFGHAAGHFSDGDTLGNGVGTDVLAELKAQLDLLPGVTFTLEVYEGFIGANVRGETYRLNNGVLGTGADAVFPQPHPQLDSTPIVEGP